MFSCGVGQQIWTAAPASIRGTRRYISWASALRNAELTVCAHFEIKFYFYETDYLFAQEVFEEQGTRRRLLIGAYRGSNQRSERLPPTHLERDWFPESMRLVPAENPMRHVVREW